MAKHDKILLMKVGRRAIASENLPNNWENLDINKLTVPKGKCMFVFGGNTTNRLDAGNGNAKIMESLLSDDNLGKTNIFSFVYENEPFGSDRLMSRDYIEETHILFEKTFKPILFDKKGNMKEMKGIEQEFGKIVFAGHCGGSCFVNIIINDFYDVLLAKYPPKTAELLINKIQYFGYAPIEIIDHNVNGLIISPLIDSTYNWSKTLVVAEEQKVDIDYPKGIIKKLLKARQRDKFRSTMLAEYEERRAIMFKVGNKTYMIPGQMNPDKGVGDHTIECISKSKFLNSGTDYQTTARIANFASRLFVNGFLENGNLDTKKAFNIVSEKLDGKLKIKEEETIETA